MGRSVTALFVFSGFLQLVSPHQPPQPQKNSLLYNEILKGLLGIITHIFTVIFFANLEASVDIPILFFSVLYK